MEEKVGVDEDRVRLVVAALRDGSRPQTAGVLRRVTATETQPAGYCCLGVICEVAIADGLELEVEVRQTFNHVFYGSASSGSSNVLPEAVQEWFGFTDDNPWLLVPPEVWEQTESGEAEDILTAHDGFYAAAELNDEAHLTLEQIADCFEYTFLRGDWEAAHGQVDA